ncbi:MAG: NUDIX hydrolase [Planctomycetaceae bacterium]|jgi:mutator protein MutT|nr:NUDIX hydrolase [Planctomycetaceae bacterium]
MTKSATNHEPTKSSPLPRRGAIGIVARKSRLLVIRRSQYVLAPHTLCFPGGGIEPNETPEEALVREFQEELGAAIVLSRQIWESVTAWNVHLQWWTAQLIEPFQLIPNAREVEEILWLSYDELRTHPDLLSSNATFLDRLEQTLRAL